MADANRVSLAYKVESSYGVAVSGTPAFQLLRMTGESLERRQGTTKSQELRSDRQKPAGFLSSLDAGGSIDGEFSYGTYDDLLEALACDTWTSPVVVTATTISFANSDNSINDSANGLAGFTAGQWIKISGSVANDGFAKIATVAAGKLTVTHKTIVDGAATPSIRLNQGAQLTNGTTFRSYNVEKKFADVANEFELFLGMVVNTLAMSVTPQGVISCSWGFIGKTANDTAATISGSYTAAPTTEVMDGIRSVVAILADGSAASGVSDFSFNYANNAGSRLALGSLGPYGIRLGSIDASGTLRLYFDAGVPTDISDRFKNFTTSGIAIALEDIAGNGFLIEIPSLKYGQGRKVAGGINQDVLMDCTFEGHVDATAGKTVRIVRFAAP